MKAFRITSKDQYVQDMNLNRGTYTFHAWVFAMGSNYSIGLKTQAGTWLNFDMRDQIKAQEWRKVKITFTIYEPCVQFSLMNTFASEAAYVIVAAPMLEEGTNAGTQKPNELDLDESITDSAYMMLLSNQFHNFPGSTTAALNGSVTTDILVYKNGVRVMPTSITVNPATVPAGMTANTFLSTGRVTFTVTPEMTTPSGQVHISFEVEGKTLSLWFGYGISFRGADGTSKDLRLEASSQVIQKQKNGTYVPSSPVTVTATAVNTAISEWTYSTDGVNFSSTPPTGVTRSDNVVSINPSAVLQYAMYVIRITDGTISDTLTVIRIEVPEDGKSPYIGETGTWWVWSDLQKKYVDTGDPAQGDEGKSPYIGIDGNWYYWDGSEWVNSGVKAEGEPGSNGLPGKMPILMDWVQGDTHYNNDTVVSYVYYRPTNTWWRLKDAYTERIATASPSTTYYQQLSSVEHLVTKIIIAEQGNLAGLIFKDNMLISQKGMINGVSSTDYGNPGFEPYVYIDGNNGEIKANKLLNPFVVADPDIPGDLQAKLTNNHNIYLESSGIITYDWKEHTLPGNGTLSDRALDGLNLKIYAPYGCNRRIRIKPAHADARIFTDDPGNVISAIKIGHDIRERIHLSAVWDRAFEVLDWVITSRTSYRVKNNQDDPSEIRVPNVFKEGDIIAKGNVYDSAGFSDLLNRYGQNIFCSVSSGRYTLSIPRDGYYNAEGTMISRTISADQFELQVTPGSTIYRNTYVYKTYGTVNGITGVHFYIEFRTYNGSTPTATPFRFILRASDYVFNNSFLDDTL